MSFVLSDPDDVDALAQDAVVRSARGRVWIHNPDSRLRWLSIGGHYARTVDFVKYEGPVEVVYDPERAAADDTRRND